MNKNIKLALIALIFAACGGDDDITPPPPPPPPPPTPTPYTRPFPTKVYVQGDTVRFYLGSNGTIDSANQGCPGCPNFIYEYDNSGRIDSSWKISSGGLTAGDSVPYAVWDYPTLDSVTANNNVGLRFGPESWERFGGINDDPNTHDVFTLQNDTLYWFRNQQLRLWAFLSDSVNPTYIDYNPCLLLTSNIFLTQLGESKRLPLVIDYVSSPGIDAYFQYEYDAQNRLIKQEYSTDPNFGNSWSTEFFYD